LGTELISTGIPQQGNFHGGVSEIRREGGRYEERFAGLLNARSGFSWGNSLIRTNGAEIKQNGAQLCPISRVTGEGGTIKRWTKRAFRDAPSRQIGTAGNEIKDPQGMDFGKQGFERGAISTETKSGKKSRKAANSLVPEGGGKTKNRQFHFPCRVGENL